MEARVWRSNRSVKSVRRDILALLPDPCRDCTYTRSVLEGITTKYRSGELKRGAAIISAAKLFEGVDNCSGVAYGPNSAPPCSLVPVGELIDQPQDPLLIPDEPLLPDQDACA